MNYCKDFHVLLFKEPQIRGTKLHLEFYFYFKHFYKFDVIPVTPLNRRQKDMQVGI